MILNCFTLRFYKNDSSDSSINEKAAKKVIIAVMPLDAQKHETQIMKPNLKNLVQPSDLNDTVNKVAIAVFYQRGC